MANTFEVIAQANLTSSATSILISSIPQSFETLAVYYSLRTDAASANDLVEISFNSATSFDNIVTIQSLSGITYTTASTRRYAVAAGATNTASFGSGEIIVNQYSSTSTSSKKIGFQGTSSGNTNMQMINGTGAFSSSSAIASITLTPVSGVFQSGCSVYLYGMSNIV